MGFFDKVKEAWRDKTRECLCADLQRIGLDAQTPQRGKAEEKIEIEDELSGLREGTLDPFPGLVSSKKEGQDCS
ncbi:hypothetical protein ACFLTJ_02385 [Chloroflexota bacterium]